MRTDIAVRDSRFLLLLAAVAAALALVDMPAVAQQKDKDIAEVKIEATHMVQRVGTTSSGIPVELVQLTRRVNYSDLNLATHSGAVALEQRINDTAQEACKQLDKLYPLSAPAQVSCVKDAVAGAMSQANLAIAAAEKATNGRCALLLRR